MPVWAAKQHSSEKSAKTDLAIFLRQTLVESSIDVSGLVIDEKIPTTLAFVQLDSKGDRSFTFYGTPVPM